MHLTDLSEYLSAVEADAGLDLPVGGRTYRVRPPTVAAGARLAAFATASTLAGDERVQAQREALDGTTLPLLALGADVVQQLTDDGVPEVVIGRLALVSMVAFVYGEDAANRYITGQAERLAAGPRKPAAKKKASTPSARNRSTTQRRGTGTA